jgi:hypothetical protein
MNYVKKLKGGQFIASRYRQQIIAHRFDDTKHQTATRSC